MPESQGLIISLGPKPPGEGEVGEDEDVTEDRGDMLQAASGALIEAVKSEDPKMVSQILSDIMAMGPAPLDKE